MHWPGTVRYNIHMSLEDDDVPLPQGQAPGDQWAEDQFDDELMRALTERPRRKPTGQHSHPQ